jgi:hypothetical protein
MNGPINVKTPNNTNKWQMGFNSTCKVLMKYFEFKVSGRQIEENGEVNSRTGHESAGRE